MRYTNKFIRLYQTHTPTLCFRLLVLSVLFLSSLNPVLAQKINRWQLVWQEEFNYNGLPDSSKWGYETGYIRNKEQQYYTHAREENVWVENGMLTITGRKEIYLNEFYKPGNNDWRYKDSTATYTSTSINTDGKMSWQYGRIEVKAKLPTGGGIWPAFWMMGTNRKEVGWPLCGEIDIMEFIGNHPTDVYGTIHFPDTLTKKHRSSGGKTNDTTLNESFHIYAIEWDEKKIDIFFDDKKYHSFIIDAAGKGNDNPFRKPFYLLINLAMGADWPGPIDDRVLPQQLLVDYVRVYQKQISK